MRRFAQFAWSALVFNLIVIVWGGLVRASHSGEGCGDHWPMCGSTVVPHAAEIATLIEFVHRATTGLAFILTMLLAVWARRQWRGQPVSKAAGATLFFMITEALLGAGLVLFHYTGTDASLGRAIYLSTHLVNTLLLLTASTLTAWWASDHPAPAWPVKRSAGLNALIVALLVALTGAITALSDTLFPATSLRAGLLSDFASGSHWLVKARVVHPVLAIAGGIYIVIVAARLAAGRKLASWVIGLVTLQIAAGVMNLYLLTPVWTQLTHLLLADLLWIVMVLFAVEFSAGESVKLKVHESSDLDLNLRAGSAARGMRPDAAPGR